MKETKLPSPRLELRWIKTGKDWTKSECVYSLVIPLDELDVRRTDVQGNPTEKFLEIGRTKRDCNNDTSPILCDGSVDTPFRDGAHAQWDKKALGGQLPIVAICGDTWSFVKDTLN
jgi:hypothetical protein